MLVEIEQNLSFRNNLNGINRFNDYDD